MNNHFTTRNIHNDNNPFAILQKYSCTRIKVGSKYFIIAYIYEAPLREKLVVAHIWQNSESNPQWLSISMKFSQNETKNHTKNLNKSISCITKSQLFSVFNNFSSYQINKLFSVNDLENLGVIDDGY